MKSISLALLIVLVVSHSPLSTAQEYDDEREWDYLEDSGKGPEHWGDLNKNWTICKTGVWQSPIDLWDVWADVVRHLGRLQTSYKPANATLLNRGHDIMLKWVGDAGSLQIEGTNYALKQCHWHSPSEHHINGFGLDLEVHMVHQSSDEKIAVVGILYRINCGDDPFLAKGHLNIIADGSTNETVVGVVDPYDLIMDGGWEYYRYMGSLTTPPCTEGVVWTVLKEPWIRTVSFDQVKKLRDAVHDAHDVHFYINHRNHPLTSNGTFVRLVSMEKVRIMKMLFHARNARSNARPIQPLNGREVLLNVLGHHPTTLQSI